MTKNRLIWTTTALVALAGPAAALTPMEAWEGVRDRLGEAGIMVSGTARPEEGRVVVQDIVLMSEGEAGFEIDVGEVAFIEAGDDVTVDLPEIIAFNARDTDGKAETLAEMSFTDPDLSLEEVGSVLGVAFSDSRVKFSGAAEDETSRGEFSMEMTSVEYAQIVDEGGYQASDFGAGGLVLDMNLDGPKSVEMSMQSGPISSHSRVWITTGAGDLGNMPETVEGFFSAIPRMETQSRLSDFDMSMRIERQGEDPIDVSMHLGDVASDFSLRNGRVEAEAIYQALALEMSGVPSVMQALGGEVRSMTLQIGLPVDPEIGSGAMDVAFSISDLAIDESVWAMVDPSGIFPRDPISTTVDLSGEMAPVLGVIKSMNEAPYERFDIEELSFSGLGAEFFGFGEFTANPAGARGTLEEMDGQAQLRAVGLAQLLEKLGEAGILAPREFSQARGLVAMLFERSDDEMVSNIVLKDGGVVLNGAMMMPPSAGAPRQ
jgi:hypothetical protein